MSIICAEPEDLDLLCDLFEGFCQETSYDVEFSGTAARQYLWGFITQPIGAVLVSYKDGEMMGCVMVMSSLEFQVMPFCYIAKFYVHPKGRGTGISRALLGAAIDWARNMTCDMMFVTATAGLTEKQQQLFVNLMTGAGFKDAGPCLALKL